MTISWFVDPPRPVRPEKDGLRTDAVHGRDHGIVEGEAVVVPRERPALTNERVPRRDVRGGVLFHRVEEHDVETRELPIGHLRRDTRKPSAQSIFFVFLSLFVFLFSFFLFFARIRLKGSLRREGQDLLKLALSSGQAESRQRESERALRVALLLVSFLRFDFYRPC